MTGSWLMLSEVARRITAATGRRVTLDDVIALGDDDGPLQAQFMHGYWSVSEDSVTAYLSASECPSPAADAVAEHADEPTVGRWTRAEDPEAFADRAHYDTPNDEGGQY
ncbi:hypothetical protein [Nonomuraea sp. GTA35]|uniref:hypothetical protein n=1 Tax=Nonomuraea sp. GTA35 TaxID=1676746 RepID=UPI0035BF92CD